MVGMDNVGIPAFYSVAQTGAEARLIAEQIRIAQIAKTCAGVWHYIAHSHNGQIDIVFKADQFRFSAG